jgi:hypothetical protein
VRVFGKVLSSESGKGIPLTDFQALLDAAFPSSTDVETVRSVQQGILLADGVLENESWLKGRLGRDVRGYLRRAAILARVHDACRAGDLPFAAVIEPMPRGPFHWVELTSGEFKAHICRTESPGMFPEDTPTRQDERLTNQPSLFDLPTGVIALPGATVTELFAWMTFGAPVDGGVGHLCWAMPNADGKSWLAHTNVLHRLALAKIDVAPEAPTARVKLKFKDQIAEALEKIEVANDQGDKK